MRKFSRWTAEHFWFSYILACLLLIWIWGYLSTWITGLVAYILLLLSILVTARWLLARSHFLLQDATQQLTQQCDPVPFFEETKLQLQYPGTKALKLIRKINHAAALMYLGRHEEAVTLLSADHPDKIRGVRADAKVSFYRNLQMALLSVGRFAAAETAMAQMELQYEKIKNQKIKQQLLAPLRCARAEIYLLHQDYDLAMETFLAEPESPLARVFEAWFCAKVHLARGELLQAKEKLAYVVKNGNGLYVVVRAQAYLDKINLEE